MFGYRVGFSGKADLMALFSIRINSRWRPPPSWIISNGNISATALDLLKKKGKWREERRGEIDVTVFKISVNATETQQSISSVTTLRYSNCRQINTCIANNCTPDCLSQLRQRTLCRSRWKTLTLFLTLKVKWYSASWKTHLIAVPR